MAGPFANLDGETYELPSIDLLDYLTEGHPDSYITGLSGTMTPRLLSLYQSAPPEIRRDLMIQSGARSNQRQKELWDAAVKKYGSVSAARKWVAPPGKSQHNKGNAVDFKYGSKEAREWVHKHAAEHGLRFRMSHEPWHAEPISNWKGTLPNPPRPVAPVPGAISPAITEKRRLFAENSASQAIDSVAPRPTVASLSYNSPTPGAAPFIPPGFDSPRGMDTSALYSGIIPKLDAATRWNDGGKGTPIQVANFDRLTDRDPYGIGSPPVTPLPKLSAPGAGATQQQRNAIAAVPQATERRYNPDTNTWTAKQTLQPRPASNAPGQTFGVGGANQAGTTQMPRDVRPSSVPAAPVLNPMLAAAVEKYEGKKAPVQGLMQVVPGRDGRVPVAPTPLPYAAGQAARSRVASIEPMPLPAIKPSMNVPMPLPRSAGDAARAKAAAQYPVVAPPIPLPYSAGIAARAKAAVPTAPVLQYSGTLKTSHPWDTVLGGVDEWWQATPAGRLGNVLGGKPQVPSRTGIPEAFLEMISGKPKAPAPQPPARKQPAFFGLLGNSGGGLFGGGGIFGGGQRNPGVLASILGGASGVSAGGPAVLTPQGNVHPGGWYDNSGNDMAYMPRSYQENPRNSNGGY